MCAPVPVYGPLSDVPRKYKGLSFLAGVQEVLSLSTPCKPMKNTQTNTIQHLETIFFPLYRFPKPQISPHSYVGEECHTHCQIALSLPTIILFPSGEKQAPPISGSLTPSCSPILNI